MPRRLFAQLRRFVSHVLPVLGSLLLLAGMLHAQTPVGVDPELVLYTHGDPSGDEQYLLELVNYARANPAAEGQTLANVSDPEILRYYSHYSVDTNKLKSDFASYPVQPPLAFNAKLMFSARTQSLDQANNGFQGHNGTNGSTFDDRITAMGYQWRLVGENVYAYAENPFFGFVGLIADWGVPQLDHRRNLMNFDSSFPVFKETGISSVTTSKTGFGPLVITQDFGVPATDLAFLVGVAYNDTDGNGFYTSGEGTAGVVVTSPQSSFYTITSASGGYTLPLDQINGGASVQVTFGDGSGNIVARQYPCGNNVTDNIKADLVSPVFVAQPPMGASTAADVLNAVSVRDADRAALKAGKIRITRDGSDLSQDLAVYYEVSGSAVAGQDYATLPGWVSIPAGKSFATVKVHPLGDVAAGADVETVTITLAKVVEDTLISLGTAQASLTID